MVCYVFIEKTFNSIVFVRHSDWYENKKNKKKVFTQSGVTMHGVVCGGMYQNNASSGSERRGEPLGNLQKSSTYQMIRLVSLFYISVTKEKKKKNIEKK